MTKRKLTFREHLVNALGSVALVALMVFIVILPVKTYQISNQNNQATQERNGRESETDVYYQYLIQATDKLCVDAHIDCGIPPVVKIKGKQ